LLLCLSSFFLYTVSFTDLDLGSEMIVFESTLTTLKRAQFF
jgi:hypothetical protein